MAEPDEFGDLFQRKSRYKRGGLPGGRLDFSKRPASVKEYPGAPRVHLPNPDFSGSGPLFRSLALRRSIRRFSEEPLSIGQLAGLAWAAAGVSAVGGDVFFRTAPSAGALYPIETYIAVRNVNGVASGLYHYFTPGHCLELLAEGDFGPHLCGAALDQGMVRSAAAVFVFSAVFERSKWKYRQRAYRYIYMDAGHIAQNLALAATDMGLGSCAIGAIYDDEADRVFDLDSITESVIYMTVIGHPRTGDRAAASESD